MTAFDGRVAPALLERLALVGTTPSDTDDVRAQKATLTIASVVVTLLAVVWVVTYLALGLPLPAVIPFAYQVATVLSLAVFVHTKRYRFFRASQLSLMLVLPFLLQWSLGGYVASSAVSLWALIVALGALLFYRANQAIPWFLAFVVLTIVSAAIDGLAVRHAAQIAEPIRVAFFVLNIGGVSLTTYLLLQYFVRAREAALLRSEGLLLNVLPASIAERLKHGSGVIAEHHGEVTVLFADVVDFTPFVERTPAARVVSLLDEIFSAFDRLAEQHGLEKIKTIGDAYMAAAGLPEPRADHARAAAEMALDMLDEFHRLCASLGLSLRVRIGLDSGPVVAGVIGRRKFIYDLWGDTVNTASRMESQGLPDMIQVTRATYDRLRDGYSFEERGPIPIKGKGMLSAYMLTGRKMRAALDTNSSAVARPPTPADGAFKPGPDPRAGRPAPR
jgi:adenylate cyclase